jgi:hypothetical protein
VDKLLDNIKILFIDRYQDQLKKPNKSRITGDFDAYFNQQVKELEGSEERTTQSDTTGELTPPSSSTEDDGPPPQPGSIKCK